MNKSSLDRFLEPKVILPALLLIMIVVAIIFPNPLSDEATHLTTYSVEARGARGLYQTAERLGWKVSRLENEVTDSLDPSATYAVLAPLIEPTSRELGHLLTLVRNGASLLYVTLRGSRILDSLGISDMVGFNSEVQPDEGVLGTIGAPASGCPPHVGLPVGLDVIARTLTLDDSVAHDTVTFVASRAFRRRELVAVGLRLGRGRAVVVSEPDIFRNDVLRLCHRKEGVLAVRILQWLAEPVGNELVFDEFHHGYGRRESAMSVIRRSVTGSPGGRVLLQLLAAALVLMVAVGTRPIPPRPRERIERRSPFEHVGALARAYENVGATRRATRLLVRGLRRRHDAAAWRRGSDEEYLRAVATSHAALTPFVSAVLNAMNHAPKPAEFMDVGRAIETIERTLSSVYS